MAKKKKFKFHYQRRSEDSIRKRAKNRGGDFDSPFDKDFSLLKLNEGNTRLRILPPTWDNAEHYGVDVHTHFGVGPDNTAYLCLEKHEKGSCPVCEEVRRAQREGEDDYANELKPKRRVLVWVIVRKKESEGPTLYSMPGNLDGDIAKQAVDEDTGEVLFLDRVEKGYDVIVSREGQGLKTRYTPKIARRSTPVSDDDDLVDEWLEFITKHSLPSTLVFYDYEHIARVFGGAKVRDEEEEEEEETRKERKAKKKKRREVEEEEEETEEIDDEDEDIDDDEDDEDDSDGEDDEDEDDADDDDDDDEDYEPVRKKIKAGLKRRKR
jgi:hypothetical protein